MSLGGPTLAASLGGGKGGWHQDPRDAINKSLDWVRLSGGHLAAAPPGYLYEVAFEAWVRMRPGQDSELSTLVQWYPLEDQFSLDRAKHRYHDLEKAGYVLCNGDVVLLLAEDEHLNVGGLDSIFHFSDGWRQEERIVQLDGSADAALRVSSLSNPMQSATLHLHRPEWLAQPIVGGRLRSLALFADTTVASPLGRVLNGTPAVDLTVNHGITIAKFARPFRRTRPEFALLGLSSADGYVTLCDRTAPFPVESSGCASLTKQPAAAVASVFRALAYEDSENMTSSPTASPRLPQCVFLACGDDLLAHALVNVGIHCVIFVEGGTSEDTARFLAIFMWYLITLRSRLGETTHFHAFHAAQSSFQKRHFASSARPSMRPEGVWGQEPSMLEFLPRINAKFEAEFSKQLGCACP